MVSLSRKTSCAAQVALQHCPILHMSKRKSMIPTGFYTVNWLNLLRKAGSNPSGQVAQNTSVLRLRRIGISTYLAGNYVLTGPLAVQAVTDEKYIRK